MHYERSNTLTDLALAGSLLTGLENFYPDFGHWYTNTCMPGVLVGDDLLIVARDRHQVVGVALGKTGAETKLRCVRVLPDYQHRSVGIHLIERALRELNCDKPHCTVAEEMLHQFSRPFVNHFGFSLSEVTKGRYRPGKLEYAFNGAT
jgi:GNAT superfamily N-acetyltransferase